MLKMRAKEERKYLLFPDRMNKRLKKIKKSAQRNKKVKKWGT